MKIRMKENSVRLRVGRSELARFLEDGRITETVQFGATREASFTYALEVGGAEDSGAAVRYANRNLAVVVTPEQARVWEQEDQVGIYSRVDLGAGKALEIAVEKDFACMDRGEDENADTFANPHLATNCQVA